MRMKDAKITLTERELRSLQSLVAVHLDAIRDKPDFDPEFSFKREDIEFWQRVQEKLK